jgi:NTP pyrophosphatase (non-canonical NTP hydrolase)
MNEPTTVEGLRAELAARDAELAKERKARAWTVELANATHRVAERFRVERNKALGNAHRASVDTSDADDTRFSLVDALLADVSCRVPGYTAGDAIETAAYLSERFTITRKSATQQRSGAALEIRHAQKLAWANKIDKGFNTTDIALEFGLLTAEVGEAFTAWRKRLPDLGEELADIVIYAMAVAEMNGLDLGTEVDRKIVKNSTRIYNRDAHGTPIRVTGTNPGSAE